MVIPVEGTRQLLPIRDEERRRKRDEHSRQQTAAKEQQDAQPKERIPNWLRRPPTASWTSPVRISAGRCASAK